jgi:hypothetical protein
MNSHSLAYLATSILSHEKIRKPVAPPTKVMKDPKKESSKKACREWKFR